MHVSVDQDVAAAVMVVRLMSAEAAGYFGGIEVGIYLFGRDHNPPLCHRVKQAMRKGY
jgi:hypothetical protein